MAVIELYDIASSVSSFSLFSFVMIPYQFCDINTPNYGMHNLHNYGHFFWKRYGKRQ
jgi:hypothetical protein